MTETGYPTLAKRIAGLPDSEGFVFRRFDRLTARNLLYLEGKLAYLEHKLNEADRRAQEGDSEPLRSIRS